MHIVVNCVWKCKIWDNKPIHECHISHAMLENKLLPWHPWPSKYFECISKQHESNPTSTICLKFQCGQIGALFFIITCLLINNNQTNKKFNSYN
jgi:hypothetical protein